MEEDASPRYSTMIRDLPQGERPRERLCDLGPRYLSNPELIAILLRTGVQGESVLSLSTGLLAGLGGGALAGMARGRFLRRAVFRQRHKRRQGVPAYGCV